MPNKLQCYNLGCQEMYDPDDNSSTSCTYHPGAPYFHDAYKGWSCCKKRSIDFTEFMNIKGCTKGFHCNEAPAEAEKKTEKVDLPPDPEPVRPPIVFMTRPDVNTPMTDVKTIVSEALKKTTYATPTTAITDSDGNEEPVNVGDPCRNNGCKTTYEGAETSSSPCVHHPGVPIFHEGYKYWSCCKKKTTEFEVFQNQKGCTTGSHVWKKPADAINDSTGSKIVKLRSDWIQTGANVTVIIYGKKCDPSKSKLMINPVKLQVEIFFPEEGGFYKNTWVLAGIVDLQNCSATMTPNKIEITMKKAEPVHWSNLEISAEKLEAITKLNLNAAKTTGVEPVDLSDL